MTFFLLKEVRLCGSLLYRLSILIKLNKFLHSITDLCFFLCIRQQALLYIHVKHYVHVLPCGRVLLSPGVIMNRVTTPSVLDTLLLKDTNPLVRLAANSKFFSLQVSNLNGPLPRTVQKHVMCQYRHATHQHVPPHTHPETDLPTSTPTTTMRIVK